MVLVVVVVDVVVDVVELVVVDVEVDVVLVVDVEVVEVDVVEVVDVVDVEVVGVLVEVVVEGAGSSGSGGVQADANAITLDAQTNTVRSRIAAPSFIGPAWRPVRARRAAPDLGRFFGPRR